MNNYGDGFKLVSESGIGSGIGIVVKREGVVMGAWQISFFTWAVSPLDNMF